jgi:hypothetical protein
LNVTTSLVTCDLETYYSSTYSLTKVTTEEYIRSPQYETIGISLKLNDEPTAWVPGPKVGQVLRKNYWGDKLVICQNTAFDGAILKWHYGVDPLLWIDIMGMSRALFPHERSHSLKTQAERMGVGVKGDEVVKALGKRYKDFSPTELSRYGHYCCNDTDLTKLLFDKYMAMGFPKIELRLLDLTLRMFIDPVLMLDEPKLRIHLTEVQDRKQALMENVRDTMLAEADPDYVHAIFSEGMAGIKKLLMSNDKFAALLRKFDVEPPTKISPTTGKTAYAFAKTDEAFKELGEHDDERIQILVAARLGNKSTLEETRTQRFIEMSHRGVFPVPLRYYGAHSGRWSGCLVADTLVTVYDSVLGVVEKCITDVLADDLVWDGVEFVMHEGVQFSGYQEVISWDNVTGTPEHVVFTDAGEISLRDAMQGGHSIQTPSGPSQDLVDAARRLANDYQE